MHQDLIIFGWVMPPIRTCAGLLRRIPAPEIRPLFLLKKKKKKKKIERRGETFREAFVLILSPAFGINTVGSVWELRKHYDY
jgi:hypothetical protein